MGLLVVNALASLSDYALIKDVAYDRHPLNTLDIYQPRNQGKKIKPLATVVFVYGGCWGGCRTINKENYRFVAESLTELGYLVVIPDYRRYPEVRFPEIIRDVTQAVEWVNQHIGDYAGDPNNIFLMGHSSGGHLAAMLTLNETYLLPETYQGIRGFIGLAGVYDFVFDEPYQFAVFAPLKQHADSQPSYFVEGREPPLLLLYGRDDTSIKPRNIINLTRAVKAKNGRVKSFFYDDVDHLEIIAALSVPLRSSYPIHQDISEFLTQHRLTQAGN